MSVAPWDGTSLPLSINPLVHQSIVVIVVLVVVLCWMDLLFVCLSVHLFDLSFGLVNRMLVD